MDFKGYFATGDGSRCDPFTITDTHIRYLIRCQSVSAMDLSEVRVVCEAAMREYGMPSRIRTDNGAPFAGTGLLGLSKLSLGWMKMGIIHERILSLYPAKCDEAIKAVPGDTSAQYPRNLARAASSVATALVSVMATELLLPVGSARSVQAILTEPGCWNVRNSSGAMPRNTGFAIHGRVAAPKTILPARLLGQCVPTPRLCLIDKTQSTTALLLLTA